MPKGTWLKGVWLVLVLGYCYGSGLGQIQTEPHTHTHAHSSEAEAGVFPGDLFKDLSEFTLAIHTHGDLRGNIGPCG